MAEGFLDRSIIVRLLNVCKLVFVCVCVCVYLEEEKLMEFEGVRNQREKLFIWRGRGG